MKNKSLFLIASILFITTVHHLSANAFAKGFSKDHGYSDFFTRTDKVLQTDTSSYKYMRFYNFLVKERYPFSMLGTLPEFTAKIKIESHARALYKGLRKDGYSVGVLGTEEQFVKKYCGKSNVKS